MSEMVSRTVWRLGFGIAPLDCQWSWCITVSFTKWGPSMTAISGMGCSAIDRAFSGMGCSAIDRAFSGMGCSAIDRAFSLSSIGPLGPLSGQSSYLKYTMKSETYVVKGKRIMPAESIRPSSLRLSSTCPRYQGSLVFVEFVWGCHSQSLFIRSICIFL